MNGSNSVLLQKSEVVFEYKLLTFEGNGNIAYILACKLEETDFFFDIF